MPNTHGMIISTSMCSWDIDAQRICGVDIDADLDNGVLVTLGAMNTATPNGAIQGYEYNVTPATAQSTSCWIIDTPLPGNTIESQLFDDPRYFYNPMGKPMSLRYLNAHVDHIEVDANAFVDGSRPADQPTYTFATIGAGGKLAIAQQAPAQGAYFALVGTKTVDVGQALVPTYVLRCERN